MALSKKDFQIQFLPEQTLKFKEVLFELINIETTMAANPDLVPLDVFLDYSQFVHKWFALYSSKIYYEHSFSFNEFEQLTLLSKAYFDDFKKNLKNENNSIIIAMTKVLQKTSNLYLSLTVANKRAEKYDDETINY